MELFAPFLTSAATEWLPSADWRKLKVTPVYKGTGDPTSCDNYRSIAVMPPFAKLVMSWVNSRLESISSDRGLRSEHQAGFR